MQWIKITGLAMILVILLSIAGALSQIATPHRVLVTNFDDCVNAGNPVMQSYPRTCRSTDGTLFSEQVMQSSQTASAVSSTTGQCVPAGCSGHVCAEENEAPNIVTTCEYKAEYVCYKSARCERQQDGNCGWTQTPQLSACLKNPPAVSQGASPDLVF